MRDEIAAHIETGALHQAFASWRAQVPGIQTQKRGQHDAVSRHGHAGSSAPSHESANNAGTDGEAQAQSVLRARAELGQREAESALENTEKVLRQTMGMLDEERQQAARLAQCLMETEDQTARLNGDIKELRSKLQQAERNVAGAQRHLDAAKMPTENQRESELVRLRVHVGELTDKIRALTDNVEVKDAKLRSARDLTIRRAIALRDRVTLCAAYTHWRHATEGAQVRKSCAEQMNAFAERGAARKNIEVWRDAAVNDMKETKVALKNALSERDEALRQRDDAVKQRDDAMKQKDKVSRSGSASRSGAGGSGSGGSGGSSSTQKTRVVEVTTGFFDGRVPSTRDVTTPATAKRQQQGTMNKLCASLQDTEAQISAILDVVKYGREAAARQGCIWPDGGDPRTSLSQDSKRTLAAFCGDDAQGDKLQEAGASGYDCLARFAEQLPPLLQVATERTNMAINMLVACLGGKPVGGKGETAALREQLWRQVRTSCALRAYIHVVMAVYAMPCTRVVGMGCARVRSRAVGGAGYQHDVHAHIHMIVTVYACTFLVSTLHLLDLHTMQVILTLLYIHTWERTQSLELQQARDAAASAKESLATCEGEREQEVSLSV
jgi:hypothetical protein